MICESPACFWFLGWLANGFYCRAKEWVEALTGDKVTAKRECRPTFSPSMSVGVGAM